MGKKIATLDRHIESLNLPDDIRINAINICRETTRKHGGDIACVDRGHLCVKCEELARSTHIRVPCAEELRFMESRDLLRIHDDIHTIMVERAVDMKARNKAAPPASVPSAASTGI